MNRILNLLPLLGALLFTCALSAQVTEGTTTWHGQSHAGWKIEPQANQGYVICGNRFFSNPNREVYISRFDEFGTFGWTRTHTTDFTSLSTFWKNFCASTYPVGYFAVESGNRGGQWNYYTILMNQTGHKMWDRFGALPSGVQFTAVCPANNGGYIACGSDNNGNLFVCRFTSSGVLDWTQSYPGINIGWSVKPANGGGYVVAGSQEVTRIDNNGGFVWNTGLNISSPAGGTFTYSEFEEITVIQPASSNLGFLVSGSTFSNNYSGVYTARISWSGAVQWLQLNTEVNTSLAGTPVAWVNNAIITAGGKVFTSWRRGPVSTGGPMFGRFMNLNTGAQEPENSLGGGNVREGFATRAHGKLVIGGTRGNLASVFGYANSSFLLGTAPNQASSGEELNLPVVATVLGVQTNFQQSAATFQTKFAPTDLQFNPASRQFYTELRVFPNPTSGIINVGGLVEAGATLRVVDINGRIVAEQQISDANAISQIDLGAQAKGIYTVQMVGANGITSRKVVVE